MSSGIALNGNATIGGTAAQIVNGTTRRKKLVIQNVHASNVLYVGSSDAVTTSNGVRLNAGESIAFEGYSGPLFGIASAAGTDVRYFEEGG